MKFNISTFLIFVLCAFLLLNIHSAQASSAGYNEEHFHGWLTQFSEDARQQGISENTIYAFLKNAEFLPRVIQLDKKQPDKTKTFREYVNGAIPKQKIKKANEKYRENEVLLKRIGKKYHVQPRFIVALWAIESDFGRNMGGFDVVNSLATLAYEGRRADFFRKELLKALQIIDEEHIEFEQMKGSWAGAMGQTQFMPSSFLELAVDENKDGKRDIWGTREDAFASIANYLSKRGWDDNSTWGRRVKLPKNFKSSLIGKNVEKTLKEWQTLGIKKSDGTNIAGNGDIKASLIRPESDKEETYLVYSNYKVIMDWNRSLYFATTVGLLSDGIKE